MSTTYRAVVHCDDQRSPRCRGFFEVSGSPDAWPGIVGRLATEHVGWVRAYRGDGSGQTFDQCPACREQEAREGVPLIAPAQPAAGAGVTLRAHWARMAHP